jgi:hypothetical protein
MSALIVIVMEFHAVAHAVARSLETTLGDQVETSFMTYANRQLSRELMLRTDLFVLDVFGRDALGARAEGIFVAEKFAQVGRRTLLLSSCAKVELSANPYYWDVAAEDHLAERVQRVLRLPPLTDRELGVIRSTFAIFCRPPHDGKHH